MLLSWIHIFFCQSDKKAIKQLQAVSILITAAMTAACGMMKRQKKKWHTIRFLPPTVCPFISPFAK